MQAHYPRIAFLLASLHTGSSRGLWTELIAASQSQRCMLFVLPGGRLKAGPGFEYMRNSVYRYAHSPYVDAALCWASTLSGYTPEATVEHFLLDTVDVPLVTFGLKIGGHPFVGIDAYSGMKALIKHFIHAHGKRRIAFIAGPRQHSSAEERYRAYCDALKEAHIAYDPALVCLDTPWTEGRRAVLQLLDERSLVPGKDFDALCTASDLLTFEAARELRQRGIDIPFDIPVGGFNDSEESRIFSPPLTTVHMPFRHQALRALRMLSEIRGGVPLSDTTLKARLVIRNSCGCMVHSVRRAVRARTIEGISGDLRKAFEASLCGRQDRPFIALLEKMLDENIEADGEILRLQRMLSSLRTEFLSKADSSGEKERVEALIHRGMVALCLTEERKYEYRLWKEKQDEQKLNLFNQELLCAKDIQSIIGAAALHLPNLGIASAYLVTCDRQGSLLFRGGFKKEKEDDSAQIVRPHRLYEVVPRDCFLPERAMPSEAGTYFILPLFFESKELGYLVVQATDIDPSLYEEVRSTLSSALRGIMLFEEKEDARRRAERAEKSKSDIVAVISRELQNSIEVFRATSLSSGGREVSRLKELVQYLLDLSQVKSEAVLAKASIFDPYAFCLDCAPGLKVECIEPPATYPALYGDRDRLARILSILAQLLAEVYQTDRLRLSLLALMRGCSLKLSLPPGSISRGPGPEVFQNGEDIRFELARQLSMLHGGRIEFVGETDGAAIVLSLPYPTLHGGIRTMPDDTTPVLCIGPGQGMASAFSPSADETLRLLPYHAVFSQDLSSIDRLLVYLDPAGVDHETSAAVSFILDQDIVQKAEVYIALHPGSGKATVSQPTDAPGFLRSILFSDALSAVVILGSGSVPRTGVDTVQSLAQKAGMRLLVCTSPAAAEAALSRWQPALFVVFETKVESQGYGLLLQRFPRVPLIVASRFFAANEEWAGLLTRPQTVFCNAGEVFSDFLLRLLQRAVEGRQFLPSPTAAIVARCILFLNKAYAEQLSRWKLASFLNASEDYLSRIFHAQMGISLWEYLARIRIEHAIELLRLTGASLAEIADRTGFRDEAYFCRVFKKMTNTTPGSFRGESSIKVRKVQQSD